MKIIMDGDFYSGGENPIAYDSYTNSDINVPRMTLEQYNSLDIKPGLWYKTDESPKGYKTLTSTSNQVYYSTSTLNSDNVQDSFNKMQKELDTLKENMNRKLNITMLHGCRNCGAKIDVEINKPIFHCKYCGTTYVIGTVQQNSTYQSRTDCQSYEESFCEARDCGECEYKEKTNE